MLHEGEHVLASHLRETLIRQIVSNPYENTAAGPQQPLASPRLQATHAEEIILVGVEQRIIGIRLGGVAPKTALARPCARGRWPLTH